MKTDSLFKNLREYVNAQPRTKTQYVIARDLGLKQNTLSQYLSGHRVPGRETALRLSRDFDISLEGLLNPTAPEAPTPAAVAS